jgi:acetyl-CoA C-acetyltransferase
MNAEDIVIVAAQRTPCGSLLGQLSSLSAPQLASLTHQACASQAQMSPNLIQEAYMGCVLQAGQGQAPARQSILKARFPSTIPSTTLNKMCGSGMKAIMQAYDGLRHHPHQVILAGGMESMSQAPYLISKARAGYRLGHGTLMDHMLLDGLEDVYHPGKLMGCFADDAARAYQFSREDQDAFARTSMERALKAQNEHAFADEITPVTVSLPKQETVHLTQDEHPSEDKLAKIHRLKPAFHPDGTVTAANSSSIADGAASLLVTTREWAQHHHLPILARIVTHASAAEAPEDFPHTPVLAIEKVLSLTQWPKTSVDLFEINEAFAVVPMIAMKLLDLHHDQVNIHGGACALGHPIGASGARIVVTLLYALRRHGLKRGIAALCIGGGEATALAIEMES